MAPCAMREEQIAGLLEGNGTRLAAGQVACRYE